MEIRRLSFLFFATVLPNILLAKNCGNVPPFLSRLRDGVDITKLDLLPLDLGANDGFKNPVFDFTCDFETTRTINNVQYNIPDQVWSVVNIPTGWLSSNIEIHKTSHAVKKSMGRKVDVGYGEGIFSASGSYKKVQDYITNSSKYIEEVTSYTSGYKINMMPDWALEFGRVAKMYIERFLPKTFNDTTTSQYMRLIDTFGTHYFNQGKFGGLLRLILATDESYYHSKTDRQVEAQASATFFNIIKLGGGGSSGRQTVDEAFTRATRKSVRYYGGSTNLIVTNGISAWQPTVAGSPWLFGGSLTEISGMIADSSKRHSMKRAIQIGNMEEKIWNIYDPLHRTRGTETKCIGDFLEMKTETKWRSFQSKRLPKQKNSYDCGAYICKYARQLTCGGSLQFTQADIKRFRTDVQKDIVGGSIFFT